MPLRLDHARICIMARTGVPIPLIAERLECSEKQILRVLYTLKVVHEPNDLIGTEDEWMLWEEYRAMRHAPADIAYRFGFSRQHMSDYFSRPRVLFGGELA